MSVICSINVHDSKKKIEVPNTDKMLTFISVKVNLSTNGIFLLQARKICIRNNVR